MSPNPYEEPRIDIKTLEKAINTSIDEMEIAEVDLEKLRDQKQIELVTLQTDVEKSPLTELQRRLVIKRVFINCVNQRINHKYE